jgi:hypothetical protein
MAPETPENFQKIENGLRLSQPAALGTTKNSNVCDFKYKFD